MVNYTGSAKYLSYQKSKVYDGGGNSNGRLDPGETANLTAFLKNIGGQGFTNLNTVLSTASPYITITDQTGLFGAIPIDSVKENSGDPYVVQAASNTPNGQAVAFRLIAQETGFADTFDFTIFVGALDYLVWNPDPTPYSGQAIDSLLHDLDYTGIITTTLPNRSALDIYRAVFVCLGIYPNNQVITPTSAEAATLVAYANSGGRIYLEGGDVWYYDPLVYGYDFCPLFGINAVADGSSDLGPVAGQSGTFTNQMDFVYAGENSFMDHISPGGTGAFLIFKDGDSLWDCGVARDAGTFKTVGTSFELGSLVDASGVSTRRALVDSIMKFFGIALVTSEETGGRHVVPMFLKAAPNPFHGRVNINFSIAHSATLSGGAKSIALQIYDIAGRLTKSFSFPSALSPMPSALIWDGSDQSGRSVPAGIYFIRLEAGDSRQVEKIILVK